MLLLLTGASMRAQSIAAEQMDERFNDGTKIPFGWFAKGWSVENGLISSDSSSSFGGFDPSTMGDGGNGTPEFDMSSFFGSNETYWLLTPPVDVKQGEQMVFSAKKKSSDDSGMGGGSGGMDMGMGSFFVVERSVYGSNKWVKVQDFYDDLGDDLKEFTVTAPSSGEFRYRFRTSTGVSIDSVAGFHIDNQAPDLYIVVEDTETSFVPYGVCTVDSTKTFFIINTGTGPMDVAMTLSNSSYFKISTNEVHVQPGDTARVDVTFVYSAGSVGWNASEITFTASDNRLSVQKVGVSAIISESGCWVEDFNAQKQTPYGWFTEGWEWSDSAMAVKSGDNPMAGGGGYLMTPPLDVRGKNDPLIFAVKKGGGDGFDMSAMMDMFMGGSGSLLTVEKSVYGSNHWDKVHEFTDSIDKEYHTLAVTGFEAGKYRFRFKSSSTLVIDSVAGYRIDNNAPDLYVTVDSSAVDRFSYGMQKSNSTKRFIVMNTGTGTLQVDVATGTDFFDATPKSLSIAAGDSAFVDVTFVYDAYFLGEHNDVITFTPADKRIVAQTIDLKAYATYTDAWDENFEPEVEYVGDDEKSFPVPDGWETDGWVLKKGDGGGLASMMGGGNSSWQANSTDNTYYLITPTLQANKGDMLYFEVNMGGGMASMFGGGTTTPLTIHYDRNGDGNWQKFGDFTDSEAVIFIAPYSGNYRLKFTGKDVTLDNFMGFKTPLEEIAIYDGQDNSAVLQQYDGQTVNVNYDRVLSAVDNGDGTWKSKAYTICLPYEFDFNKYYEKDQVKLYRLVLVDDYYYEFVFTNDFPVASAGLGYLAVVNYGSVNLNAVNAKITASLKHEELADYTAVYSYKDFKDKKTNFEPIGTWRGTFNTIGNEEATAMAAYGNFGEGQMKIICSDSEYERTGYIPTFRAFYEPKNHQSIGKKSCEMKFIQTLAGDLDEIEIEDFPADAYGDDEATGIDSPVFHIIEADGSHRYFDLQGRQLNNKPRTGIYIMNGKKYSEK